MTNEVTVVALDKRYKKLEKDLREKTEKILLFLKQKTVIVEVYLVSQPKIRALNRLYGGKDKSTNVLAFEPPSNSPRTTPRFLGEIYLCPSYIKNHGQDLQTLLAHGILHLLGFNHKGLSDRINMERMERKIADFIRERSERK